ncbi:hypothetical protein ZWY2020_003757 [Hordeum vulgare]|nr:hypothetical protein ZWY2020_003757 [Hordeum vulgare]
METPAAAGQGYPAYALPSLTRAESGGRNIGIPCLTPALRNERMPKDFKGSRKVPNYTPDLEPGARIESYELAMDMLDGIFQQQPPQGGSQQQNDNGGFQNNPKQLNGGQYHVFTSSICKRDQKVGHGAFSVIEPALPRYLNWSEQPIVWSREHHPAWVDNPADLALVVAPQVGGYTLSKVLMDGGSTINILYFDTFRRMNFSEGDLMPSSTVFHDIVPGKSAYPVGQIKLNVAFGTESNYRSKSLMFEVVKIKSPYHALFDRPAYARFMALPCYVYLKLKMSGPKGTITINRYWRIAQECEEGDTAYAELTCAAEELKFHQANIDPTDMTPLKKPTIDSDPPLKFKPTDDTKLVDFVPGDSSKQFTIRPGLDPK